MLKHFPALRRVVAELVAAPPDWLLGVSAMPGRPAGLVLTLETARRGDPDAVFVRRYSFDATTWERATDSQARAWVADLLRRVGQEAGWGIDPADGRFDPVVEPGERRVADELVAAARAALESAAIKARLRVVAETFALVTLAAAEEGGVMAFAQAIERIGRHLEEQTGSRVARAAYRDACLRLIPPEWRPGLIGMSPIG
jgi:hypothetical protein